MIAQHVGGVSIRSRNGVIYAKYGKSVMIAQHVGGVSTRSRNRAPSRKGCVVNGQMTKARNK